MSEPGGGRERRRNERHVAAVPVHIHEQSGLPAHTALIRELSVSGAQILTRTMFEVGSVIQLDLYIRDTEHAERASGRIIRVERRKERGLWPIVVAVEFDTPLTEFEREIHELAEKTAPSVRG
jgi:Na+-transporting NADH:ubiquinone oxidoreductase subunit NqrA